MHLGIREWGRVAVAEQTDQAFTRAQANAVLKAARNHPLGGDQGTSIVSDHHRHMSAKQIVGVIAAPGCSLEILPKIGSATDEQVRDQLIQMLDVALGLNIGTGEAASLARQNHKLLDILIRLFADRLLAETRRGLPRAYVAQEDDLPNLRGRLDVVRQFTINAVRPDRLACRFDALTSDIALLQIMKACVVILGRHARFHETQRRLMELRLVLADVSDVAPSTLPWAQVRIDRTNQRWGSLFALAKLFLKRDWQATHHQARQTEGITLLFPMNILFESYVAVLLRRALRPHGLQVIAQGGLKYCLGDWQDKGDVAGNLFQTKPDLMVKRGREILTIIDTKWKQIDANAADRKNGVSQADVYQLMAYAQLYACNRLMLLYPHHDGLGRSGIVKAHGIAVSGRQDRLSIATVDIRQQRGGVEAALAALIEAELGLVQTTQAAA